MKYHRRAALLLGLVISASVLMPCMGWASNVRGTVIDKTTNRPDAGDDVVLVALTESMQDVARTKTDASGHFTMDVPDERMHLIRVDHQKAAYFAPVTPGESHVNVAVYDVRDHVNGITSGAEMIRLDTGDRQLHVVQTYFVKNDSSPARTQFGPDGYAIELPAGASVEGGMVMGPGGMPVVAMPIANKTTGRYAFLFPIRPGETRFQVGYRLPYSGTFTFVSRILLPTANIAVVLPTGMRFSSDSGLHYETVKADAGVQMYLAKSAQAVRQIRFDISGMGALPGLGTQQQGAQSGGATSNADLRDDGGIRPGGGSEPAQKAPDPLDRYKGWILGGVLVLFVGGAIWSLRIRQPLSPLPMRQVDSSRLSLVSAANERRGNRLRTIKEEMVLVEAEHLQGSLLDAEYREQMEALAMVLKRSLQVEEERAGKVEPATQNT